MKNKKQRRDLGIIVITFLVLIAVAYLVSSSSSERTESDTKATDVAPMADVDNKANDNNDNKVMSVGATEVQEDGWIVSSGYIEKWDSGEKTLEINTPNEGAVIDGENLYVKATELIKIKAYYSVVDIDKTSYSYWDATEPELYFLEDLDLDVEGWYFFPKDFGSEFFIIYNDDIYYLNNDGNLTVVEVGGYPLLTVKVIDKDNFALLTLEGAIMLEIQLEDFEALTIQVKTE